MLQLKNKIYYKTILFIDMFMMTSKIKLTFISVMLVLSIFSLNYTTEQAQANEQVKFSKQLLSEVIGHMENKQLTEKQKKQKLVDTYMSVINFEWNAKIAMGRSYNNLTDAEKKQYVNEYTKFLAYTWLPKLEMPTGTMGVKLNVLEQTEQINKTDEYVKLQLKMEDGVDYLVNIRVSCVEGKCQLLNINMEGLDLALSYRAQFENYIEKHGGSAKSIIKYLQEQNAKNSKTAGFVVKLK